MIALMMEAASISETTVNFYQTTWRNNSHIQSKNKSIKRSDTKTNMSTQIFNLTAAKKCCQNI
jgi:hypothetical protein